MSTFTYYVHLILMRLHAENKTGGLSKKTRSAAEFTINNNTHTGPTRDA
jgi:hypothetical protein